MNKKEKAKLISAVNNYFTAEIVTGSEIIPGKIPWFIQEGSKYRKISKEDWDILKPFFKAQVKRTYTLNDDVQFETDGMLGSATITTDDSVYIQAFNDFCFELGRNHALCDMVEMFISRVTGIAKKKIYKEGKK